MRIALSAIARAVSPGPMSFIGAIVVLALVAPSQASAQTRTACYIPKSGTVYMIKEPGTPQKCNSPVHVEFSWTASGATGPQGPAGPSGAVGPQGPTGASGPLAGLEFHSEAVTLTPVGAANYGIFRATCSTTTKSVMNFGYQGNPGGTIYATRPAIGGNQLLWAFQGEANTSWVFYWTCVDGVTP